MVWIFQDGHLGALGTTSTGTLVANIPVLLFCVAFGLSMDYEVFLVSRIREFWLASDGTRADNDESVARGIAHTGRIITAAALIMSISFAALIAAHVAVMRMFGVGLTLAVLVDATLVRMVLVPAFMHVMGQWNWWAPRWMVGVHRRLGFSDGHSRHVSDSAILLVDMETPNISRTCPSVTGASPLISARQNSTPPVAPITPVRMPEFSHGAGARSERSGTKDLPRRPPHTCRHDKLESRWGRCADRGDARRLLIDSLDHGSEHVGQPRYAHINGG